MESAKPFTGSQALYHHLVVRLEHRVDGGFDLFPSILAGSQAQPDPLDLEEGDIGVSIDQFPYGAFYRTPWAR